MLAVKGWNQNMAMDSDEDAWKAEERRYVRQRRSCNTRFSLYYLYAFSQGMSLQKLVI